MIFFIGVNEENKFLNVPEITHLFASKKIKAEKFLFTCNGANYGQIHLPAVNEPLEISNRVFGVTHSTSIQESNKWVFEITVYRTQADVQINHDSIYGIRVYQFFQGIKNEIHGVIHKFEVSSNHKSIIEDDFLHFLDEIFASSKRNGPMLQDIEYSTRLPSNYEVPCISGFKEIKGSEQGYRDRYDIIYHGHEKKPFMCFFHRPIFTEMREFAAIVIWMLAVFNCLGRLS